MTSLQSSLRNVFGGWAAAGVPNAQAFPKPWPLFKLAPAPRAERPAAELASIVASEIIPRLMLAHRAPVALSPVEKTVETRLREGSLGTAATESFTDMLLSKPRDALIGFAESLQRGGISVRTIYDDLLVPTARMLDDLWADDRISYTEVTIGLGRLEQLIHTMEWTTPYNGEDDPDSPSALFAPRPGEEQTFGFYMIEESFRWSGWRAWVETSTTNDSLRATVQSQGFDTVCLSVTRDTKLDDVSKTIEVVRGASRNPDVLVLLSGSLFIERPSLVALVGADAAASNGSEALDIVKRAKARPAVQ